MVVEGGLGAPQRAPQMQIFRQREGMGASRLLPESSRTWGTVKVEFEDGRCLEP